MILLGLDGATFANLKPWAEQGILLNFARLMRESAHGPLASTVPPTTPPAWTSCVTGKNPGKHGVFDFRESPYRRRERPLTEGSSARGWRIWEILNARGLRCGVLNVPITWPPERIDGFMISGMMTPGPESEWAEPPELKAEVVRAAGGAYYPDLDIARYDTAQDSDALAFLRDVEDHFDRRRKAFFHLMDTQPWDFYMAVFILPDRIQHLFWKYLDPAYALYNSPQAQRLRERILAPYRAMDAMIGELLDRLDGETNLIVVSDHGFGGTDAWFNVNVWLEQRGWLRRARRGAFRKWLFYQAMLASEGKIARALIPGAIQSAIRRRIRSRRNSIQSSVSNEIDWTQTRAFFSGVASQGVFLNLKGPDGQGVVAPGAEAESLRREIKQALLDLEDPRTGERVVEGAWLREELYEGPETPFAPDVFFQARNYGIVGRALFGDSLPLRESLAAPNGFHRPDGVLLAHGPDFAAAVALEGARIMDVAPTVLHAMGQAVPDDMDGRVLTEAFRPGFRSAHPVRQCPAPGGDPPRARAEYAEGEKQILHERLRALGYEE